MNGQFRALAGFIPEERALSSHWKGGWMRPRTGHALEKIILSLSGIEPRFLASSAHHYVDFRGIEVARQY
jgi:hypothetical protein